MNINIPRLWPEHAAEIARLDTSDDPIAFEHIEGVSVPVDGCWELSVVGSAGRLVENRILFRAGPADDASGPDLGVHAWATLSVLWALGRSSGAQG